MFIVHSTIRLKKITCSKHFFFQEALQALNFMASGGGLPHPLLPPPGHSPMHLGPHHFPPMSLHKGGHGSTSSTPGYTGK